MHFRKLLGPRMGDSIGLLQIVVRSLYSQVYRINVGLYN